MPKIGAGLPTAAGARPTLVPPYCTATTGAHAKGVDFSCGRRRGAQRVALNRINNISRHLCARRSASRCPRWPAPSSSRSGQRITRRRLQRGGIIETRCPGRSFGRNKLSRHRASCWAPAQSVVVAERVAWCSVAGGFEFELPRPCQLRRNGGRRRGTGPPTGNNNDCPLRARTITRPPALCSGG